MIRYLFPGILAAALCLPFGPVAAQILTPTALEIHGPNQVYESSSADFTAVVTWSDGTKSQQTPTWSTSNTSVATITQGGMLMTQSVASVPSITPVTVQAQFSSLSATKSVAVLDASLLPSVSYTLSPGWNLLGNTIASPISVSEYFGHVLLPKPGISDKVISVWKWNAATQKWAYFSPALTPAVLESTAVSKGYVVLRVIFPGDGFWVNTLPGSNVTLPARTASPVFVSSSGLVKNWNLLATGQPTTPSGFNLVVSGTPPQPPESLPDTPAYPIPVNFVSLWAWDAPLKKWLYYSPQIEANSGLGGVTQTTIDKGYLDFTTLGRTLGHGIGYWVNILPTNTNPSSNLAPIGQAKAMISELRTTIRGYTNDLKTGFLDAQSTRIRNDLQFKVTPVLPWVITELELLGRAVRMYEDVKNGVTSSYAQEAGSMGSPAGTVRAGRTFYHGSVEIHCFSNDMTTQVTIAQLVDARCTAVDTNDGAWAFSFPNRTQLVPRVTVSPGATSSDYNYQAIKRNRTEQWNGSSWGSASNTQIGATQTGVLSRTYLPGTTHLSNVLLTGNLPSKDLDADHDAVILTMTRAVDPNAVTDVYRYSVTGSVASKTAAGVTMVTWDLASGSYYDVKEDPNGNPLPNSLQAVHAVGTAQTTASRFTGTLDVNAFGVDADNLMYSPMFLAFNGTVEDLSSGGAGTFLTGLFTLTHNNLASYRSGQPESASNFEAVDASFTGTINAPSRPVLSLTFGASRTGLDTGTITTTYGYGTVSVTGTGAIDTLNEANNTLTLTNQDGIKVTFQPHADAVISKGTTTLGIIPLGSSIVYFIDGYFESL